MPGHLHPMLEGSAQPLRGDAGRGLSRQTKDPAYRLVEVWYVDRHSQPGSLRDLSKERGWG